MSDRDGYEFGRGFLTQTEKEYLESDDREQRWNANSRRQKRFQIKERARNALNDFALVFEHLADPDRTGIFDPPGDEDDPQRNLHIGLLHRGAMATLAVLFENLGEDEFEAQLERAITHVRLGQRTPGAAVPQRDGVDVDLVIEDVEMVDLGALADKLDEESIYELTNAELSVVMRAVRQTGGDLPSSREGFAELAEKFEPFGHRLGESWEQAILPVHAPDDDTDEE